MDPSEFEGHLKSDEDIDSIRVVQAVSKLTGTPVFYFLEPDKEPYEWTLDSALARLVGMDEKDRAIGLDLSGQNHVLRQELAKAKHEIEILRSVIKEIKS